MKALTSSTNLLHISDINKNLALCWGRYFPASLPGGVCAFCHTLGTSPSRRMVSAFLISSAASLLLFLDLSFENSCPFKTHIIRVKCLLPLCTNGTYHFIRNFALWVTVLILFLSIEPSIWLLSSLSFLPLTTYLP